MIHYAKIVIMSILSVVGFGARSQSAKTAKRLFKNGDFMDSQQVYQEILKSNPKHLNSLVYMGYTSLLLNRLEESEHWFQKTKAIKPGLQTLHYFLSEIYYRQKEYAKAAPLFRAIGKKAMADKMEYFSAKQAYLMDQNFEEVVLSFLTTDPLPVVEVTINNALKGHFILDTGGGELILSSDFAARTQITTFGIEKGNGFGGGKKAPMGHGAIESITLKGLTVKNVPVATLQLNQLELGGYKIDGIIGTVFLSQFLSTIDYKKGQLVLRNKAKFNMDSIVNNCSKCQLIPFVLAGDHFIMAKGQVNNNGKALFFVDTGLAGQAFTCPKSSLKRYGLSYNKSQKDKGLGGGGYFDTYPMDIERICLGNICVKNLHGMYGAFPKQLETSLGFNVDGLISHEFFRNFSLTIDFDSMNLIVGE